MSDPPATSAALAASVARLRSGEESDVTEAAVRLGLLLERHRFQQRGTGSPADIDGAMGDLVSVDLSASDTNELMKALRTHVSERGLDANPTVVWAIGKAHDESASDLVAKLAARSIGVSDRTDLLRQALVTLEAVAPGAHRELFIRAARDAGGDPAEFATGVVAFRGWQ